MIEQAAFSISSYDLPDSELLVPRAERDPCVIFVPPRVMVVIGKGSNAESELNVENVLADGIPVLRRPSGGSAVVLSPNMLAVSFACYETRQQKSSEYFMRFNGILVRALNRLGLSDAEFAGTSDIARQGRKLIGTAIYRNRDVVFYHAIVNVAESGELIERYLRLPPRMPSYRDGRSHQDFVSSLAAEGFLATVSDLQRNIEQECAEYLCANQTI